jgi:hypothetical protein
VRWCTGHVGGSGRGGAVVDRDCEAVRHSTVVCLLMAARNKSLRGRLREREQQGFLSEMEGGSRSIIVIVIAGRVVVMEAKVRATEARRFDRFPRWREGGHGARRVGMMDREFSRW